MKQFIRLFVVVVFGISLVACDASAQDLTYAPSSYGSALLKRCYYLVDPQEVITLKQQGFCAPDWIAWPMPSDWEETYFYYYSSSTYINAFVPVSKRTIASKTVITFQKTHVTQITTKSKTASWKSSTGQTYTGRQVNPTGHFSSGNGRTTSSGSSTYNTSPYTGKPSVSPRSKPSTNNSGGYSSGNGRTTSPSRSSGGGRR